MRDSVEMAGGVGGGGDGGGGGGEVGEGLGGGHEGTCFLLSEMKTTRFRKKFLYTLRSEWANRVVHTTPIDRQLASFSASVLRMPPSPDRTPYRIGTLCAIRISDQLAPSTTESAF